MKPVQCLLLSVLLLCVVTTAAAQTDCPTLVRAALSAVDVSCTDTGRNQVCYGNVQLVATPREGATLAFDTAGDRADVTDIQALQLSSMSLADRSWGVALMQVQANLPDTLPGQNVTFLLFGNVEIENRASATHTLNMTALRGVNVRLRPTTTANNIIASLRQGDSVSADGRLADSSWVRVQINGSTGWVAADFLSAEDDLHNLPVVEAGEPSFGPMQAFAFRTGLADRPCAEAPDSGILIQTPAGSGKITINANGVQIRLGSTVYLQAQPNNLMTVSVVEGEAVLEVFGQTQTVPAGTYSQIPMDNAGQAAGTPSYPRPYDAAALATLPLGIAAFASITVAAPLTPAQIETALATPTPQPQIVQAAPAGSSDDSSHSESETGAGGTPRSGTWNQSQRLTTNTCDPSASGQSVGTMSYTTPTITFSDSGDSLVWDAPGWMTLGMGRTGDGVYQSVTDYDHLTITIAFTSTTSYNFTWSGIYPEWQGAPACEYIMQGSGTFQG
jgi:uncharacterized protein YraI